MSLPNVGSEIIAPDGPSSSGLISVIDVRTGETELISKYDSRYYSADGLKTRRYKNSSEPKDVLSFVWQSMSIKARKEAIQKEQKEIALRESKKEPKGKHGMKSFLICQYRDKIRQSECYSDPRDLRTINSLVARPVNKKEIRSNPKAREAIDLEWNKLIAIARSQITHRYSG